MAAKFAYHRPFVTQSALDSSLASMHFGPVQRYTWVECLILLSEVYGNQQASCGIRALPRRHPGWQDLWAFVLAMPQKAKGELVYGHCTAKKQGACSV